MPTPSSPVRPFRYLMTALIVVTCLRVWIGPVSLLPEARAQVPDSAKQRIELLRETQRTNDLLRELIATLKTHTIKVSVEGSDKPETGLPVAPGSRGRGVPAGSSRR